MRKFAKYQMNLCLVEGNLYSYSTKVAVVEGDNLHQLGSWSKTTQKHINYAASELGLTLIRPI
jgi:phytoene/squalene synthetase